MSGKDILQKRSGARRVKDWAKRHMQEVLALKTSPHALGFGFAIGTCISVLPTFGFGTLLGALIVLLFKRISKIALFAGLAFWNPLFVVPVYSGAYYLGDLIYGDSTVTHYDIEFLNHAATYSRRFLVGDLILTGLLTVLGYVLTYQVARRYQARRAAAQRPAAASDAGG